MSAATTCPCGKPAEHVNADPDSQEWSCRVPLPVVDHGVTIETVSLPAGNPFRARCLCGWTSPTVPSRPAAVAAGEAHTSGSITEHAVTITAAPGDTQTWQATCRCGWQSAEVADVNRAAAAYQYHSEKPDPIECRPWCIDQDGHGREAFRDDQRCQTEILSTPLAHPHPCPHPAHNGTDCAPAAVWVYASQQADADEPSITICLEDEAGVDLTLAEARELVENVGLVVGQVG